VLFGVIFGVVIGLVLHPLVTTRTTRRRISGYGLLISVSLVVLWLGPITYTGFLKKDVRGYPRFLRNSHRVSCLFVSSTPYWRTEHYQVRFLGSDEWIEGPEPGFFEVPVYGYRTRFNRLLRQSIRIGRKGVRRQEQMGDYIQQRWSELSPDDPIIAEVRYIRAKHYVGEPQCMARGAWVKPRIEDIPEENWEVVASHAVEIFPEDLR